MKFQKWDVVSFTNYWLADDKGNRKACVRAGGRIQNTVDRECRSCDRSHAGAASVDEKQLLMNKEEGSDTLLFSKIQR